PIRNVTGKGPTSTPIRCYRIERVNTFHVRKSCRKPRKTQALCWNTCCSITTERSQTMQRLLILTAVLGLFAGFVPAPNNSNAISVNPMPVTPSPSASPSPATLESASVQVTLPLLDALLSDEKFVGRLKTNLKLTDDQITALKRASSAEIDRLRETN